MIAIHGISVGTLGRIAWAFVRHDMIEELKYPANIALRYLGLLFPVLIQFFVARLVDRGGVDSRIGGDYFSFALVGLSVSGILQFALGGFGLRLQWAQDRGTLETYLVEPVPWSFVPLAMNIWHVGLGFVGGALTLLLGLALGAQFSLSGVPGFVLILLLGTLAAVSIGILSASFLVVTKRSQPIIALYGMLASLVGGALFPVSFLPRPIELLSYVIPHRYVIAAGRQFLMEAPPEDTVSLGEALVALSIFDVVVLSLGIFLFTRTLHYARKVGLLGSY